MANKMTNKMTNKAKKQITFFIDHDVADEFRELCYEQNLNMSGFLRTAILNKLTKDKKENGANKVS